MHYFYQHRMCQIDFSGQSRAQELRDVYHTQNDMFNGKQDRQIDINCRTISKRIDSFPHAEKKQRIIPLKIFPYLFSYHE